MNAAKGFPGQNRGQASKLLKGNGENMKRILMTADVAMAACSTFAGLNNVKLSTAPDRVKTPLKVDLEYLGTLVPRSVREIPGETNWRLGCEVLDRDYIDFDEYKEHVAPLGIKLVRLQGGWAKCEKEKGRYDFAWLDHIVDTLMKDGVECAIETSYGNPIYEGGGTPDLAGGFPTSEEGLAAWDAWVDALTQHFSGRVKNWLMWNEPDIGQPTKTPEMIAALNVRTAQIVKRNVPDAKIAGLSLAYCNAKYFEECLKCLGENVKLFDTFIYHGYAQAPESSYTEVEKHKDVLARLAPHAKLWQGENGAPSEMTTRFALSNIPWTEYSQAKWNLRRMLGDLGHDVYSSIFTICDFSHTGREINLKGLLRADEDKKVIAVKRAYYAVQNLVSVFDSTLTRVPSVQAGEGFGTTDGTVTTYEYRKASGEPLFVFWIAAEKVVPAKDADDLLPEGWGGRMGYGVQWVRPGDSFETRPLVFTYTGKPLNDPVWVDLLTGRVYAFPKKNQIASSKYVRFLDVPVYDSPCLLTERSALKFVK